MLERSVYCLICRQWVRAVSVAEAGQTEGVHPRTIYRWMAQGKIHRLKTSSRQIHICENSLRADKRPRGNDRRAFGDERITRLLELIEENYPDPRLTLSRASHWVGLSMEYVSRRFKQETGCGFRQFVRRVRVEKAAVLLVTTGLSIKEVAAAVGYMPHCVSEFDRHFKETYGLTPTQYRATARKVPEQGGQEGAGV
ncbi:MAG TPA: AraC family transcriptional regulator [Blastocatellia bacterium]|nr:AraC family transcriptional regulator [Blastocatellia bacterium]